MEQQQQQQEIIGYIKNWLDIENKISTLTGKLRELRKEKKQINEYLLNVMKDNEIDCFDCNSGKIIYTKNNVKKSINKKYLQQVLTQYCDNNEFEAEKICNYIMDNRIIETKENIKLKKNII
jgi:hypothetical protein